MMKLTKRFAVLGFAALFGSTTILADTIPPLVYSVEETGTEYPLPPLPAVSSLQKIKPLTDPLQFSDGSGRATEFEDWSRRRWEISKEIQKYEIGTKPAMEEGQVTASMSGNTLTVKVTVNGKTLTLTSTITYPSTGKAPYPLIIGTSNNSLPSSIFTSRGVAMMTFSEAQVNNYSQFGGAAGKGNYNFDKLYPSLKSNGAYAEWSWGVSRLIDGLYLVGSEKTKIDLEHIGVTGCSYAGKMALFAGAFDERIALTIAQEPGGGGAAAWRVSEFCGEVEKLGATDGNWFLDGFQSNFSGGNTIKLPYDHHELCAMVCPRALLVLGNPDMVWLADESGYISSVAARKVWEQYGIEDRMGYSIVGGHGHCQLPNNQYPEVEAFVDKFLCGKESTNTNITIAPKYAGITNADKWTAWWGTDDPSFPESELTQAFKIYREAENMVHGSYGKSYKKVTGQNKSTVSNGIYLETTVNYTASTTDPSTNLGTHLQTTFTIPEAGTYYVFARVNCGSYDDDSYFVRADGKGSWTFQNGIVTNGWEWKNFLTMNNLSAGEHTLVIASREDGAKIDKILITDYAYPPENGEIGDEDELTSVTVINGNTLKFDAEYTDGKFNIDVDLPISASLQFSIIDQSGKQIASVPSKDYRNGYSNIIVPTGNLPAGIYVCSMQYGNGIMSKKLVIK